MVLLFLFSGNKVFYAKTINEADTELCETVKAALISSNREPVDKAISEIYKNDKNAPKDLTWASWETEILKIKQVSNYVDSPFSSLPSTVINQYLVKQYLPQS
ncbi:hypothetical protein BACCIP111895_04622 [Neobacillus rhizosphaerae]|uniref:Uncharacterized protein n=1 Tax=Neobacillus rhizosphaerae TaxID=2880965 RepID=A0ABN8KXV3_9BACI|nr:DUF3888 domain-containing protein [Neobacillus rhizosphaerae]CAH2717430.1 hypothetical protein BACCIP111895_04622 [Neobacillus rhizosphaerae]